MRWVYEAVKAAGPEAPAAIRSYHDRTLAMCDRLAGPARTQAFRWASGRRVSKHDWDKDDKERLQQASDGTAEESCMLADYLGDVTTSEGRVLHCHAANRINSRMAASLAIHIRVQVASADALVSEGGDDDREWRRYVSHLRQDAMGQMVDALG